MPALRLAAPEGDSVRMLVIAILAQALGSRRNSQKRALNSIRRSFSPGLPARSMEAIWALIDEDLEVLTGLAAMEVHECAYRLLCQDLAADSDEPSDPLVGSEENRYASATAPSEASNVAALGVARAKQPRDNGMLEGHACSCACTEASQLAGLDNSDARSSQESSTAILAAEGTGACPPTIQASELPPAGCDAPHESLREHSSRDGKVIPDLCDVGLPSAVGVGCANDATVTHATGSGTMLQRLKVMAWPLVILTETWVRFSGLANPDTLGAFLDYDPQALETTLAPHLTSGRLRWNRKRQGFYCRVAEQVQLEAELNAIRARQGCQTMPT